jgi:LSD1 subclass zinc finger protein
VCPTCREPLDVELAPGPQKVRCTFCRGTVPVPSLEQAQRRLDSQRPLKAAVVEEYPLVGKPTESPQAATKTDRSQSGVEPPRAMVVVSCPTCHERMRATAAERPRKIRCLYCAAPVTVPARAAVANWSVKSIQPEAADKLGEYGIGAIPESPKLRTNLMDRLAEFRTEKPIPPPRWTFFSGVFSFPWRQETFFRWGGMTLGFTSLILIAGFVAGGGAGTGVAGIGVVALGFFILPAIWIAIFTLAYSADCFLCVVESTAHGMDRIESWPEGGWKEWAPKLLYVAWAGAVPILVSAGIARAAEIGGVPFWPVMLGLLYLMYPVALLSALEANSIWVPITGPIFSSLFLLCWGWFLFYVLTGLLAAAVLAVLYYGLSRFDVVAVMPVGPLLAASILIYARLLGRLAWKIGRKLTA